MPVPQSYPGVPPPMAPEHRAALDAAAQKQGFRDYNAYYAYQYQLDQKHQGSVGTGGGGAQPAPAPAPAPTNHLNGGVAGVMDYIRRAMGGH